jgi:hypothetical protein
VSELYESGPFKGLPKDPSSPEGVLRMLELADQFDAAIERLVNEGQAPEPLRTQYLERLKMKVEIEQRLGARAHEDSRYQRLWRELSDLGMEIYIQGRAAFDRAIAVIEKESAA